MPEPITYLFVPADRPERFVKALSSGADRVIIDLEDAVTPKNKMAGRDAIKAGDLDWSRVIIRINDGGSTHFELDLAMIRDLPVQTIMVPKADGQGCLKLVDEALDNKRMLIPQIETVKSLFALPEILAADNVDRVAFGHLDFALDSGSGTDQQALAYARSQIVLHSRLAGMPPPIDSITVDFRNESATADDARAAKNLGFGGKLLIHPAQIAPARDAFLPSPEDVVWARGVLQALETEGRGTSSYEGRMIDLPVEMKAREILGLAEGA